MRLLVYEMRTSALEEQGLAKAIQNRLDAVEKRSGIDVHFQADLEAKLPEPLEIARLVRAIQDEVACLLDLAAILHYHQCRNHAAYCSHRKRARS